MDANSHKSKNNADKVNESFLMNAMAKAESGKPIAEENEEEPLWIKKTEETEVVQKSNETLPEREERRESRKKKTLQTDYEALFIRSAHIKAKVGKTIYLRPEYHRRVARIIQSLEDSDISLTDYVDNVFTHHFRMFEQEIKEFFNKNNEPIL